MDIGKKYSVLIVFSFVASIAFQLSKRNDTGGVSLLPPVSQTTGEVVGQETISPFDLKIDSSFDEGETVTLLSDEDNAVFNEDNAEDFSASDREFSTHSSGANEVKTENIPQILKIGSSITLDLAAADFQMEFERAVVEINSQINDSPVIVEQVIDNYLAINDPHLSQIMSLLLTEVDNDKIEPALLARLTTSAEPETSQLMSLLGDVGVGDEDSAIALLTATAGSSTPESLKFVIRASDKITQSQLDSQDIYGEIHAYSAHPDSNVRGAVAQYMVAYADHDESNIVANGLMYDTESVRQSVLLSLSPESELFEDVRDVVTQLSLDTRQPDYIRMNALELLAESERSQQQ